MDLSSSTTPTGTPWRPKLRTIPSPLKSPPRTRAPARLPAKPFCRRDSCDIGFICFPLLPETLFNAGLVRSSIGSPEAKTPLSRSCDSGLNHLIGTNRQRDFLLSFLKPFDQENQRHN